jgi:glycerate 2-kinase
MLTGMKIIIATDKFKGSLSSLEAGEAIRMGLIQAGVQASAEVFPMADGGDGFAEVMKYYLGTQTVPCITVDPLMRDIHACWEWDAENKTAVIELASAAGLVLLQDNERDPLHTSTYGAGLLVQDAIKKGAQNILLGLGGSASNDAGIGILAAMGFIFKDAMEQPLLPTGANLQHIRTIDIPAELPAVKFTVACDVTNVLFGKSGAAFVFAPQKGADVNSVEMLEKGLRHFASLVQLYSNKDVFSFAGSGAAGGVPAGLVAFFDVTVESGASIVIDASQLKKRLPGTGMIITGEGRLDETSLHGKVVQQVTALGNSCHIPVVVMCGENTLDKQTMAAAGLQAVYPLVNDVIHKEFAMANTASLLSINAASVVQEHGI